MKKKMMMMVIMRIVSTPVIKDQFRLGFYCLTIQIALIPKEAKVSVVLQKNLFTMLNFSKMLLVLAQG